MWMTRLLFAFSAPLMVAHGQVPGDASLSMFMHVFRAPGLLSAEARSAFLESSGLSAEQVRILTETVDQGFEIENLEGNAARMRKQPGAEFTTIERNRLEILHTIANNLENSLGDAGWAKLSAFLRSIEQQMRFHRDVCDSKSAIYTFGTLLKGQSAVTAVAVADRNYTAGDSRLYAHATLRSPESREISAKSPTLPIRVHAAAVAALPIGIEDGSYQSTFEFGEFCGEDKIPRILTDKN
jgi:hypothetical protein